MANSIIAPAMMAQALKMGALSPEEAAEIDADVEWYRQARLQAAFHRIDDERSGIAAMPDEELLRNFELYRPRQFDNQIAFNWLGSLFREMCRRPTLNDACMEFARAGGA
jgi:hypothetical protein